MLTLTMMLLLPAASSVDQVVVFADRADIRRVQKAKCQGGTAQAVFEKLPVNTDLRTLRGGAAPPAKALGVSSERVVQTEAQTKEAQDLEAELRTTQAELTKLLTRQGAINAETARLDSFDGVFSTAVSEQLRGPKPNRAAWRQAIDDLDARRLKLKKELVEIERTRTAKQRALVPLQRRLNALRGARQRQTRRATVTVSCKGAQATVYLGYVVGGAGWSPEYDLRFQPQRGEMGAGQVKWSVAAVIRQSTGEDWTKAKLRLSTSKPRLGAAAPMPRVVWLDARKKRTGKILVENQEVQRSLQQGQPAQVTLEDGGKAVELSLPGRVDVKSDGRPNWFVVKTYTTQGSASWIAYPKDRAYVYRAVSFKNPAPHALLAAPVHSFYKNAFVGDATTPYRGPGEPMEVSLGIDGRFSLNRKVLSDKDKGAGWLSSTKHVARAYRTIIRSSARKSARIEVRENVPVSKNEDIEIELKKDATTPGFTEDKDRGWLTWQVKVASGAEKEVRLGYEIHLPEDWVVPGRR